MRPQDPAGNVVFGNGEAWRELERGCLQGPEFNLHLDGSGSHRSVLAEWEGQAYWIRAPGTHPPLPLCISASV